MTVLEVSTITPVYAGYKYIEELIIELSKLHDKWENNNSPLILREAIFVVDDAIDESAKLIEGLASKYNWLRVINLSRNFGQHPATIAGILYSSGDWVITLDEDLQHHPRDIENLLYKAAQTQCDIVYAKPISAVHSNHFRNYSSKFYKYILSALTKEKLHSFNSFRLIRGTIARATASVCSHETYFDVALLWFTQRVETLELRIEDNRVINGLESTYSLSKLLSHAGRMIVTTRTKVLRVGMLLGISSVGISMIYAIFVLCQKIFTPAAISTQGWASLIISILFLGGLITFLVGIILEYVAVILLHIQGKPTFFVVDRSSDTILKSYFLKK